MNNPPPQSPPANHADSRANHPREIARDYIRRGWAPIPVPFREKGPKIKKWQNLRLTERELKQHFPGPRANIGVLLGAPSGGLVDIDLDHPLAVKLADQFLPKTGAVFGRSGRRSSHRLYKLKGDELRTRKFTHPALGSVVEIRADGCQTVFPGSTHPCGEDIEWESDGPPALIDAKYLEQAVMRLFEHVLAQSDFMSIQPTTASSPLPGANEQLTLLQRQADEVTRAAKGTRNNTLNKAAFLLARHVRDGSLTESQVIETLLSAGRHAGLSEPECTRTIRSALSASSTPKMSEVRPVREGPKAGAASGPSRSQATKLIELASAENGVELFRAAGDGPATLCASIHEGDALKTFALGGAEIDHWLASRFYETYGVGVSEAALGSARITIAAKAENDGCVHPVGLRIAEHDGCIYVDLRDPDWRVIEISAAGWRILGSQESPVRFVRRAGMRALPAPARGGSIEELRQFINVADDRSFVLIVAWLIACFRPGRPFPILLVSGQQGSAKSTLCRMLRALVDPSDAPLCALPRDERNLVIAARNSWMLAFDNLSKVSAEMSDALCRMATGGGLRMRALFTDDAEAIFQGKRPILMNGIDDVADRPDLLDRSVMVQLDPIPDAQRQDEATLWRQFDEASPRILGALLDGVSGALARIADTRLASKPRMADFALWATSAESALGWSAGTFMGAYSLNKKDAHLSAIEASPVAAAVLDLIEANGSFEGIAKELLERLNSLRGNPDGRDRASGWPDSPRALSSHLRRLAPVLQTQGIAIDFGVRPVGRSKRKLIRIDRLPPDLAPESLEIEPGACLPSEPTPIAESLDAGHAECAEDVDANFPEPPSA